MFYQTMKGERVDVGSFGEDDAQHLNWLLLEFSTARSWMEFQERTAHGTIEYAKDVSGRDWKNHPLFTLQLDLMARTSVRTGEARGEISDMLVVPESLSGSWSSNGDIDLVLTTGQWRVLTTPYDFFWSDKKYEFFTASEGVLVGSNVPSEKTALLRVDDSLKNVPDGVQVDVRENVYRVGVTKNVADAAMQGRVQYVRFGAGFRMTLKVE
mgnify:CR=1 FL=1